MANMVRQCITIIFFITFFFFLIWEEYSPESFSDLSAYDSINHLIISSVDRLILAKVPSKEHCMYHRIQLELPKFKGKINCALLPVLPLSFCTLVLLTEKTKFLELLLDLGNGSSHTNTCTIVNTECDEFLVNGGERTCKNEHLFVRQMSLGGKNTTHLLQCHCNKRIQDLIRLQLFAILKCP